MRQNWNVARGWVIHCLLFSRRRGERSPLMFLGWTRLWLVCCPRQKPLFLPFSGQQMNNASLPCTVLLCVLGKKMSLCHHIWRFFVTELNEVCQKKETLGETQRWWASNRNLWGKNRKTGWWAGKKRKGEIGCSSGSIGMWKWGMHPLYRLIDLHNA